MSLNEQCEMDDCRCEVIKSWKQSASVFNLAQVSKTNDHVKITYLSL